MGTWTLSTGYKVSKGTSHLCICSKALDVRILASSIPVNCKRDFVASITTCGATTIPCWHQWQLQSTKVRLYKTLWNMINHDITIRPRINIHSMRSFYAITRDIRHRALRGRPAKDRNILLGRDVNIAIGRWFDIGPQNHRYNIIFIAYFPYHSKVEQLKLDGFLMQRNFVSR